MKNSEEKLKHFEKKLKYFADDKFGSLSGLADKIQKSPSYLTRIAKQKVKPSSEFFIKLLELGCDINWLIDDSRKDLEYKKTNLVELNDDEKKLIADVRKFTKNYGSIINIIPAVLKFIDNQKTFHEKTLGSNSEK